MMLEKVLSENYLKGRESLLISIIPFPLVVLLTWAINLWLGRSNLLASVICMAVISLLLMAPILVLRQYELAAAYCLMVSLYVGFYIGVRCVKGVLILVLLLVFYFNRSP